MIQNALHSRLRPLIDAEATLRRRKALARVFTIGSIVLAGLFAAAWFAEWGTFGLSLLAIAGFALIGLGAAAVVGSRKVDPRAVVQRIEDSHPDLRLALLTAFEQMPGADGQLGFLQEKVIFQAVDHAIKHDWVRNTSRKRLLAAGWQQFAAILAFFLLAVALLGELFRQQTTPIATAETMAAAVEVVEVADYEIEVRPGHAEVERGTRLIIEAAFLGERIPPGAAVVLSDPSGDKAERGRIAMKPGLDAAVFSGLLAKVDSDLTYRIEFDGKRSDEFSVSTFIHPELEQADATVTAPDYANLPPETLEDVRKVSMLEGSELAWSMNLNKPIAAAELFGEDETSIPLVPSAEDPTVLIASHQPAETQKYRLHLVDADGRANKLPPWFTVTVKRNLPPKLDFKFPKRDVKVTAVQELPIEATVWDDLGVTGAGAVFEFRGEAIEVALADVGSILEGDKSHALQTLFAVEEIGAQPRDLVTYHVWAEDIGPDGANRRTLSDQFFAEVRHFEDIFREADSGEPGEGEGQATPELLKLQKEVMNATWKLIRQEQMGRTMEVLMPDVQVISESQEIARGMTLEAIEEVDDPELKGYLADAAGHMEKAVTELDRTIELAKAETLSVAHDREKDAYQSLLLAQSREHNITRSQEPASGQPTEMDQQMMELEMKQEDKRYEEESKAQEAESPEQQEALVVLNRLKELAKRQEAIAEKIKELQNALEEAETPEEKDELERQLQRLQEEQKELLRELDNLTERMDTEENRANMAEARQQLEETREKVQETSEQLDEGNLAEAANTATRAERELEEVTEEFREKTSRAFSKEVESIRDKARRLAEQQESIGEQLDESNRAESRETQTTENGELASQIEAQRERLDEVLDEMRELSESAEDGEPLLSNTLYEAVRDARTQGIDESLAEARNLTSYGRREVAQEEERTAARGIEELKEAAEKAAEMVLGSEADSLRMARSELESLIEQTREESERLASNEGGEPPEGSGQNPGEGEEPGADKGGAEKGKGKAPGEGEPAEDSLAAGGKGEPGEQQGAKGEGEGKGEGEAPGESMAQGKGEGQGPSDSQAQGEGQGQGQAKGEGEGKGDEPGESPSDSMAQGKGEGAGKGPGQGKGESPEPGEGEGEGATPSGSLAQSGTASGSQGGGGLSGGDGTKKSPRGTAEGGKPMFFNTPQAPAPPQAGPLTGEDYEEWADRLRNIESMVNQDEIRNEVAKVLDDARAMRIDFRSDNLPPQADTIDQRILNPLVEIRNRVAEELAKLDQDNPLSPIDRDPVPQEYRELVRKYYEELGSGR